MALQKFSKWTRAGVRGSALLNVMIDAAGKAGRNLVRHFHDIDGLQVSTKGPMDFATEADRRAEHILFESLSKARPNYGFLMVNCIPSTSPTPTTTMGKGPPGIGFGFLRHGCNIAHIQKAGFLGSQKPQIALGFPQFLGFENEETTALISL